MAIYFAAGAWTAWRTSRVGAGIIVAVTASAIGSLFSLVYLGVIAIARIDTLSSPGGSDEVWGVPLILLGVSLVAGSLGAAAGKILRLGNGRDGADPVVT